MGAKLLIPPHVDALKDRWEIILVGKLYGATDEQIGYFLNKLSPKTVQWHWTQIRKRIGADHELAVARYAIRNNLVTA